MAKRDNAVRQAVEKVGGLTQAAAICRVRERTVDRWRKDGKIPDLPAALRLAARAGIPVERFAPGWDE